MADDDDKPEAAGDKDGAEPPDGGPDLATLARFARIKHPTEKARCWALKVLADVGWSPDEPKSFVAWGRSPA